MANNSYSMLRNKIRALFDNLYFDNWVFTVLQRTPFHKENLVVYRKGKLAALVDFDGGDASGTRSCLTSGMYSRYYDLFKRTQPMAVLDLGANGGGFPLSLILAGFTFSKLVCVEMNRNTYTRLCFNLNYNIPKGVVTINAAVAGQVGTVKIPVTSGGTNESIDQELTDTHQELTEIPLVTLDGLVHAHFGTSEDAFIEICKMDVERAEYEILYSEACSTIRRVRYLIIEIHPHKTSSAVDLINKICSYGFERIAGESTDGGASVYLFRNAKIRE